MSWFQEGMSRAPTCYKCDVPMELTSGKFGEFFVCGPCDVRWYTDGLGNPHPMKGPGDAATRRARMDAHAAFDRLWKKPNRYMKRGEAYRALQGFLGLIPEECHIAKFDVDTCGKVIEFAHRMLREFTT